MTKDTKLSELVINKLTTAQYNGIATKDPNQLYVVTDAPGFEESLTNCLTHIPQDIKLELVDGALTLKAGSKVYIPNGFEADGTTPKFDVVTIASDVTATSSGVNGASLVYYTTSYGSPSLVFSYLASDGRSGTTPPTNGVYYNLSTNQINYTSNGTIKDQRSLPFGIVQRNNPIASIDQVFNGFGYVGSTAFALPGVKGLIPNGRNADSSLRNIEFTVDKVVTRTITWNNSAGQELFIGKYAINRGIEFISTGSIGQIYQQENAPSLVRYSIWYKPSENKVYRCDLDSNSNLVWKDNYPCYIGQWFTSGTSPYPITELTTRLPFRAVDYNEFQEVKDATLNYDNITNCITEIPQDIKLEFNITTKVLTLKTGSKLYIPNGSGIFNEITINSDKTLTNSFAGQYDAICVCWDSENDVMLNTPTATANSGTSDPSTASNRIWYDTTANKIKYYQNSGTTVTSDKLSLPICIMQNAGSGNGFTKIQQIFNGFGYIGSTEFILPSVKGLIPNGRNEDGTLKNIEFKTTKVSTKDVNTTGEKWIAISSSGIADFATKTSWTYNEKTNFILSASGSKLFDCFCGDFTKTTDSILNWKPKTAFRAVDYFDAVKHSDMQVVSELPAAPVEGVYYFVKE